MFTFFTVFISFAFLFGIDEFYFQSVNFLIGIAVSPMLLVVFASLSRKINDETLTWWWLSRGTLLFYVNFIVGLVFIFLFILLYCTIMKKLVFLWNANKVERKITIQRYVCELFVIT